MICPKDSVFDIVRTTFEEMTFLDVAQATTEPLAVENGPILFLPYSHPKVGSLALNLPKEIKFLSAENIYGESWKDLSSNQIDDSLLEMLNVLVGRLLTKRFGEETAYVMGLPTVLFEEPQPEKTMVVQEEYFRVDEFRFSLHWFEELS